MLVEKGVGRRTVCEWREIFVQILLRHPVIIVNVVTASGGLV